MASVRPQDYLKGYKIGFEDGKKEAMLEVQKLNENTSIPSNETMFRIFRLLFECQEIDRQTSSCYMNQYEHYANYITLNWAKE